MKGVVEGFWDCPYCDTKRIRGRYYYCPNCGKGRGQDTKFYPPDNITEADLIEDRDDIKRPDQYCEFCDSYINFKFTYCPNCGAERGKKNYFDIRAKKEGREVEERDTSTEEETGYVGHSYEDDESECDEYGKEYSEDTESESTADDYSPSHIDDSIGNFASSFAGGKYRRDLMGFDEVKFTTSLKSFVSRIKIPMLIFLAVLAMVTIVVSIFMPRYEKVDVVDKAWSRTINVESYEWVDRSDWSLPSGAELQYTNREIHHYDKVFDHRESYQVSHQVREVVGYRTVTHDRGNGYFDVDEEPVYGYRTEYETKYRDVYRDEPVYRTKYYYKIQEWVYNRSYDSSGKTDEPYWPEIRLAGENEREGSRNATYTIVGMKKDKQKSYTVDLGLWKEIEIGQTYEFKVTLGHIDEIVENKKGD